MARQSGGDGWLLDERNASRRPPSRCRDAQGPNARFSSGTPRCAVRRTAFWKASALMMLGLCAGCASTLGQSSIPLPEQLYEAANQAYARRHIDDLIVRYGPPESRTTYDGHPVLVWRVATTMQWRSGDRTTTVQGKVSDANRWPFTDLPYSASYSEPTYTSESYRCSMLAAHDAEGTILGLNFLGKMGACQAFMP